MRDLITTMTPAECLDRAETYMLAREGATEIRERTAESVSFAYRPPFTSGESCMILIGSLLTFGTALLYVAFRLWFKQEVRMIARPTDGRTRILIDGKTEGLVSELRQWAKQELVGA